MSVSILKWPANNGLASEVLLTWNRLPGSSWQHDSAQLVPADTTKAYESVHDGKRCLQGLRCRSEFAIFRKPACTSRARGAFGKRSRQALPFVRALIFPSLIDLVCQCAAIRIREGSMRGFSSVVGSRCSMTCRLTRLNTKRAPGSPEGVRPASRCPISEERDSAESASEVCREHIGMSPLRRLETPESDTQ